MLKMILEKNKIYIEGGKSSIGIESTIIDFRKKPKILRLGGIEVLLLKKTLKKEKLS